MLKHAFLQTEYLKGNPSLCLCTFVSFTCMHKLTISQTYLRLLAKIFKSIVVTDSDTVVCGSNMLLRLAKYTVDMTRLGILFRQLTNMDTISSPSSDQQPHNTNIHWIPASQGITLFCRRILDLSGLKAYI